MHVGQFFREYWPIIVVGATLVGSGAVAQFQISAHAEDLRTLGANLDATETEVEQIQRLLIRRSGEQALQMQRLEREQQEQGEDLETILILLEEIRRGN